MSDRDKDMLAETMRNTLDYYAEALSAVQNGDDERWEDLDALDIVNEKGEPFSVALSLGGPNIYLVDLGRHGGERMVGYWGGDEHVICDPEVESLIAYYREAVAYD